MFAVAVPCAGVLTTASELPTIVPSESESLVNTAISVVLSSGSDARSLPALGALFDGKGVEVGPGGGSDVAVGGGGGGVFVGIGAVGDGNCVAVGSGAVGDDTIVGVGCAVGTGVAAAGCVAVGDVTGWAVLGADVSVALAAGCEVGVFAAVCGVGVGTNGVGVGDEISTAAATGVTLGNIATSTEELANGVCPDFNASSSAIISARILSLSMGASAKGACIL